MATRVSVRKKGGTSLKAEVESFLLPLLGRHLDKAGQLTEQELKNQITGSLVRPGSTGNLADSIFAERISIKSVGIGNVSYLDQHAIYWRAINYGSNHMVGKQMPQGTFSPGIPMPNAGSFRDGRFYAGQNEGGNTYAPIVRKPIEPHNYIERTANKLSTIAERALNT